MNTKRLIAAVAAIGVSALVLAGCSAPQRDPEIVAGSQITVAWNDPFFAYNGNTTENNATANNNIVKVASSGFFHYDPTPARVYDEQFGKVEKLSDSPLTIKYTINDAVKWSDGTPMDAADMLLYWASQSVAYSQGDIPEAEYDDDGNVTNQAAIDAAADKGVFWGTGSSPDRSIDLIKDIPTIDGKSFTVTYSQPYPDWEDEFSSDKTAISAHGTVQLAFPGQYDNDAQKAKDAFVQAVKDKDWAFLGKVATAYRTGYNYKDMPSKPQQTLSNGPYVITDLKADQYVTLSAREDFTWGTKPKYEKVTVRFIADPQAQIQALENGEVQIVSGQPTVDILQQLENAKGKGIQFASNLQGTYEHVDLQVGNGGVFDPATYGGDAEKARKVREAFLLTIPRQEIVDKLIKPLMPDAVLRESHIFIPGAEGYDAAKAASGVTLYDTVDIAKAQALLAEAGVTNPTVRILTAKTNTRRQNELALMTESAKSAGFNVVDASSTEWSKDLTTKKDQYDAAIFGWQSTALGHGESGPNYTSKGINNHFGWNDPKMDELFQEYDRTVDPARQQEILIQAETIIYQQAWSVPIYQFPGVTAWSDQVENVKPGFLSPDYFWNVTEWAPAGSTQPTK